jgi:hypothetical protein
VASNGQIQLNGEPAEPAKVDEALKLLARRQGVVLYGREGADGEPHPNALRVLQMIVEHQLPVSMSTKRDFRDVVDVAGHATPHGR